MSHTIIIIRTLDELEQYRLNDGYYFSKLECDGVRIIFNELTEIPHALSFYNCKFKSEGIWLQNCNFKKLVQVHECNTRIQINYCISDYNLWFYRCNRYDINGPTTDLGEISISSCDLNALGIEECSFSRFEISGKSIGYMSCTKSSFNYNCYLSSIEIKSGITIIDTTFSKPASLRFSDIISLKNSISLSKISLSKCHFFNLDINRLGISDWYNGEDLYFFEIKGLIMINNSTVNDVRIIGSTILDSNISIQKLTTSCLTLSGISATSSVKLMDISRLEDSEFNIYESNLSKSQFTKIGLFDFDRINIINSRIHDLFLVDESINFDLKNKVKRLTFDAPRNLWSGKEKLQLNIDPNKIPFLRKEVLRQFKVIYAKANDKTNERIFHALEMEEYLKIPNVPFWDKLILQVSKYSSDFGQSIIRPFVFNGLICIVLLILYYGFFNKEGFIFSFKNHSWDCFWDGINIFIGKWFLPFNTNFHPSSQTWLEALFKVNSGLFFYNVIRASRKFYH